MDCCCLRTQDSLRWRNLLRVRETRDWIRIVTSLQEVCNRVKLPASRTILFRREGKQFGPTIPFGGNIWIRCVTFCKPRIRYDFSHLQVKETEKVFFIPDCLVCLLLVHRVTAKQKQRSVYLLHISGTKSQTAAGLRSPSTPLNADFFYIILYVLIIVLNC